jgi:hypothetical protein
MKMDYIIIRRLGLYSCSIVASTELHPSFHTAWVGLSRSAEAGGLSQTGGLLAFAETRLHDEVAPFRAIRVAALEPRC